MESGKPEEIDLIELAANIKRALGKHVKLIIILPALGFFLGILFAFLIPKFYESKLLISSDLLTFENAEELILTLNELNIDKNNKLIFQKTGIPDSSIDKIGQIKIENALKDGKPREGDLKTYLLLTARVTDPKVLPSLRNGLINYLENNEFVKVRVEQRKNSYRAMISQIDKEINSLREMKKKIYEGNLLESSKGNFIFDPTTVNTKIVELTKARLDYEGSLQFADNTHILEDFTPSNKPVNGRKSISALTAAFIGLFVALAIIALKSLNAAIKERENR